MLQAENRNIKANYTISSNIVDGYIPYVSVLKNGKESNKDSAYKYSSSTAFNKLWNEYFANKFNPLASEKMDIEVTLLELKLREQAATSLGLTWLTGYSEVNVDAIANIKAKVVYHGREYETVFEVTSSDYNESQNIDLGYYTYTINATNPTQQKAQLIDKCLNKSVVQFENFLRNVMLADQDKQ
jgi:hypothetical protein